MVKPDNTIKFIKEDGSVGVASLYEGKVAIKDMNRLKCVGEVPISAKGVIQQRVRSIKSDDTSLPDIYRRTIISGSSVITKPNGKFKIVENSETLREITLNTHFMDSTGGEYSRVLPEGTYDKTQGIEFQRRDIGYFVNGGEVSFKESLRNPIWEAVLGGDMGLFEEYFSQLISEVPEGSRFNSVYIGEGHSRYETETPLVLNNPLLFYVNSKNPNQRKFCEGPGLSTFSTNGAIDSMEKYNHGSLIGIRPEEEEFGVVPPNFRLERLLAELQETASADGGIPLSDLNGIITRYSN